MVIKTVNPDILFGWEEGKKRRSNNTGEVYATRKDKRIADRPFLKPRDRVRNHEGARRAKSVREP